MRVTKKHEVLTHAGPAEQDQLRVTITWLNLYRLIENQIAEQAFLPHASYPSTHINFDILKIFLPHTEKNESFHLPQDCFNFPFQTILSHLDIQKYLAHARAIRLSYESHLFQWLSEIKIDIDSVAGQIALLWGHDLGFAALKENAFLKDCEPESLNVVLQNLLRYIYGPSPDRTFMIRRLIQERTLEYELKNNPYERLSELSKRSQELCSIVETATIKGFFKVLMPNIKYERTTRKIKKELFVLENFTYDHSSG